MARTLTFDGDAPQRVNKWLAQQGVCSRREAEALIERGQVSIDGATLTSPGHKIAPGETLTLAEAAASQLSNKLTLIINKPMDIVSGTPEGDQVPAVRLLKRGTLFGESEVIPGGRHKLAPIGRLDQDSHGLLIMSEDGVVAKAVIGPDSAMTKEYLVSVIGEISDNRIARLRHGLNLDGRRLKMAEVTREGEKQLRFVLREGRNRQIRRMCDLVGLFVTDLQRIRIGPIELGDLPLGQWRPLSPGERAALIAAGAPKRPQRGPAGPPPQTAPGEPPRPAMGKNAGRRLPGRRIPKTPRKQGS